MFASFNMMFAGGFNPLSLSPTLWLDASDSATLLDAGGLAADADEAIATWSDKSGNARHATQTTSGSRPLRKTAQQNSRDVVRFDGADDMMSLASDLALGTAHTIFVVAKNTATITAATSAQLLINGGSYTYPSTTTSEFLLGAGSLTGTLTNERLCGVVVAKGPGGPQVFGYGKTDSDVAGAFVLCHQFTTAANAFYGSLNGASSLLTAASPGGYSAPDTKYPTIARHIGARSTLFSFWNGDIHEILIFPTALSDTNRQAVESYLNQKWAIY